MNDKISDCPFNQQDIQRCPFLRNINKPTNFSFASLHLPIPENGASGPIFEDESNFDAAFKLFHGKDGIVPLSDGDSEQKKPESVPKFNPLAGNIATISLSAFGPGGPFSFGAFSEKWKMQKHECKSSKKESSLKGDISRHEALGNEWLENGNCPIAKSYRAVSKVLPLVASALKLPPGVKLKCPPAVVAARAALARTALVKNLRPQPLPEKMLVIGMFGMAANIPLGVWREHTRKFSLSWFIAVHAAVPFIAMLRKSVLMPKTAMAFTIAASILGQVIGSRAERFRLMRAQVVTVETIADHGFTDADGLTKGQCRHGEPIGGQLSGKYVRLKKSLYGLKQAPRAWYTRFATYILSQGFRSSVCDNSLFVYTQGHNVAYLLLYVDDIVLTASSDALLHDIIQKLSREFAMTDLGHLHHFLGIKVTRRPTGLFLDQSQYAKEILARASMTDCKPCTTPVDLSSKLSATDGPLFHDPTLYRSLAGALQYLTFTRPDISYAVQQVCLFMHEPHDSHYAFMKRILRYLQGTLDYGIRMVKSGTHSLTAYSDADWGGCPDSRRSTSGYCVFLGDNLLSWSSKRQPTVSRSSAEAEYKGVANAVAEATWIRNLLLELHVPLKHASVVYCDNVSAVYMSDNPVQHQRTKHIEIDIHFVREKVRIGHIRVLHVPSSYQYADIFTKGLSRQLFHSFRSSLTVCPANDQTAGGY